MTKLKIQLRPVLIASKVLKEIEQFKAIISDLQQRLNRNSSLPPTANPCGAPKLIFVRPTGYQQGGQKGRFSHYRQ
jgi:hypothetical protein